jgi:hypothetical protein
MAKAPTKAAARPTPAIRPIEPAPKAAPPAPVLIEPELAAPPPPAPPQPIESPTQTAEVVEVQTRYGFPVYVPTQKKQIAPADVVPLILDSWVRNQLEQPNGALVRARL